MRMKIIFLLISVLILLSETLLPQISEDAVIITLREQSSIFLDSALAIRKDNALNLIKDKYDTLKSIHALPDYVISQMVIKTNSEWSRRWYEGDILTGQPAIDSLNLLYNLVKVDTPLFSTSGLFVLNYVQPLKIKLLADIFEKQSEIEYAEPNYRGGDGDNIEFVNKDSIWHFAFSIGRGDCPAGCMYRYYWYVSINVINGFSDIVIEEEHQRGVTPPIIYRWNIPDRYPMTMFKNVPAIFDSIKCSPNWWVRRHAVEGIRCFLKSTSPWAGEDINDHWYKLKNSVDSLREDVKNIIIEALNDPDEDVRASAENASEIISDVKDKVNEINGYYLSQNYPNPFNPTTNLGFQIAEGGLVVLKVFDVLGNEIATLVNEEKAPGYYNIIFDAGKYNLSSGIYFYRIKAGEFTSSKKFILMK